MPRLVLLNVSSSDLQLLELFCQVRYQSISSSSYFNIHIPDSPLLQTSDTRGWKKRPVCAAEVLQILGGCWHHQFLGNIHHHIIIFYHINVQIKWAVDNKLFLASPSDYGGWSGAMKRVLEEKSLRETLTGIRQEFRNEGFTSIEITDDAFVFHKNDESKN